MTGEATRRGDPERPGGASVTELIGAMRRLTGLLNSSLGMHADGTVSDLGRECFAQLKSAATDLADTTPASLEDLAAVVAFAQAHCVVSGEAARNFDPLLAAEHAEIAGALLSKASGHLETMTGQPAAELGLGHRLN